MVPCLKVSTPATGAPVSCCILCSFVVVCVDFKLTLLAPPLQMMDHVGLDQYVIPFHGGSIFGPFAGKATRSVHCMKILMTY